jgi:Cd2+/Zn2+-exporting ATPase
MTRIRLEAASVALALAGMIAGLLAERAGAATAGTAGYAIAYAAGGWAGTVGAASALRRGHVDIDLLMILAALGAVFVGAPFEGAMLLFLFSLSNVLQTIAIGRSRRAIEALMELRPETARIRRQGTWVETSVEDAVVGDVFLVTPGDRLPLDGEVVRGAGEVDEASLTGESVPVDKAPGDPVFGGTINGSGALEVRVTRPAGESAIARLIRMVEEAQGQKAETQRIIDRYEEPYALAVIGLTILAVVLPTLVFGAPFRPTFYRAMTLMVAASPCALVISTPAAVLSAIAAAARSGVLFKGGVYVEAIGAVRAVAFDKTGTLTVGRSRLTDLVPLRAGVDERALLALAAGAQTHSEHHLGEATMRAAAEAGVPIPDVEGFEARAGRGVGATVGGRRILIGNARLFELPGENGGADGGNRPGAGPRFGADPASGGAAGRAGAAWARAEELAGALRARGRTAVFVAESDGAEGPLPLGVMAFADEIRPASAGVVRALRDLGIEHLAMITGDNRVVAEAVARRIGLEDTHAEVLPERKVELVRELGERFGSIAYVGDGVNDAPALAAATVGIAMGGAGTDVALETADVVLMGDDLTRLPFALDLGRRTRRVLIANLTFAVGIIVVMIAFILTVGLPLPLAVVGHEGSTVLVSLNGLRLLGARPVSGAPPAAREPVRSESPVLPADRRAS